MTRCRPGAGLVDGGHYRPRGVVGPRGRKKAMTGWITHVVRQGVGMGRWK